MLLVQMHGEPGSGKSTLARALAPRIGAIVLDKDIVKSALLRSGASWEAASSGGYEVYFDLARSIVLQKQPLILDNPVFWESVERHWLEMTALAGSPAVLIECVCRDGDELRRRLASRPALESQPREPLDLTLHAGSAPTAFESRLTLDTTRPLEDLVTESVAYIAALAGGAAASAGVPSRRHGASTEPARTAREVVRWRA